MARYRRLTHPDRCQIYALLKQGSTQQQIARHLGVSQGSVSRELARNSERGRRLRFGYRVHVIVRETAAEARLAAHRLLAHLDDAEGALIKARSLDSASLGVGRQAELRESADHEG
jgi:IS30 family transposase